MVASLSTETCLSSIVRFTISTSQQQFLSSMFYVLRSISVNCRNLERRTWNVEQVLFNCHEAAGVVAGFALGALVLEQFGHLALLPDNGLGGAGPEAGAAFH